MVTVIKNELKNRLFLQIKSGKILDILWAFLIKELFHSRLLDMRRLSTISYPTHTRGIIVKYPKHCYCHLEVLTSELFGTKGNMAYSLSHRRAALLRKSYDVHSNM